MAQDFSNLTDPPYPRGIVNNNPGNLRIGIPWQGLRLGLPGGFCSFVNLPYGIRAMAKDLTTKVTTDGLNTIAKEVAKYAPSSENDTAGYIAKVSGYTGWGANDPIDLSQASNLLTLIRAHMNVELGEQYSAMISDQDIADGMALMGQTVGDQIADTSTNFFATNPELSAAFGLGLVAVFFVVLAIVYGKLKLSLFKKVL